MAPMHEAAERGDVDALAALVRDSQDPGQLLRARDAFDRTPLLWAARRGHAPAVAWLLDRATSTSTAAEAAAEADHFGNTSLHVAAREGFLGVVSLLVARGADPTARNRYGWTALIAASVNGRTEVVRALLEHGGSNVDARWGSWGLTALHQACFHHHAEIVQLLLQHGADPRVVDRKGHRPLHVARGEAQPQIAAMLEAALAEPQRAQCLARARLLADAAHATGAGLPLSEGGRSSAGAAARTIAQRRIGRGVPPPIVSVRAESHATGVLEGVVASSGLLAPDLLVELLDMLAPPWDPARRRGQRHVQRQRLLRRAAGE